VLSGEGVLTEFGPAEFGPTGLGATGFALGLADGLFDELLLGAANTLLSEREISKEVTNNRKAFFFILTTGDSTPWQKTPSQISCKIA
jgi:hypothetical protein